MRSHKNNIFSHTIKQPVNTLLVLLLALMILTACDESGGGELLAGGGIGGTGISVGEISGFGSVIVNDVAFDTQKAQVVVNSNPVGGGDSIVRNVLALGMVVRVEGTILGDNTGRADRIVFNENLKGPVTGIETLDSVVKKVVVLDQIVLVDERTQFQNTDYDSLAVDDVLQISGWPDGTGFIQATYVAKIDSIDDEFTVKGIITKLNLVQQTLHINQLIVDFSDADLDGFPKNLPAADQLVIIRGFLDANGVLVAEEVSLVENLGLEDADDVKIEGIVTKFSSPQEFVLGTTHVQTDEATRFKRINPDEIVPGVRLFIKGSLLSGVLLADEVFTNDKVSIEGRVADVGYSIGEITLIGLSPLVIRVTNNTKISGHASQLVEIQKGQHIKVLGYVAGEDQVEATRIRVEIIARDKVKLRGPVTFINLPTIHVMGVAVDTRQIPENKFKKADDGKDDDGDDQDEEQNELREEFLNNIAVGDVVNVRGQLSGNYVDWLELELTDDD